MLAIFERLATADPSNAGWQRDLSVSHEKVGDVLTAQGRLDHALEAYRASLAIAERLAAAELREPGGGRGSAEQKAGGTSVDAMRSPVSPCFLPFGRTSGVVCASCERRRAVSTRPGRLRSRAS